MLRQRNAGGVEKPQAGGGFERGRGNGLSQFGVERVGQRAGEQTAVGQIQSRLAGERAENFWRRRTVGGAEGQFVTAIAVFGQAEIQAQWLRDARKRLAVVGHDAVGRERHSQQAVQPGAGGGVGVSEQPPAFGTPRSVSSAPQRQRIGRDGQRAFLELLGDSSCLRLFEFGKPGVCVAAPLQSRLFRAYGQTQFERAGFGNGRAAVEFAEPIVPPLDFLVALPLLHLRFNQMEIRDPGDELRILPIAPAQFPRDVKPEIKIVGWKIAPEIERFPVVVSVATAGHQAQVGFRQLADARIGKRRLHLADESGFLVPKLVPDIFNEFVA